MNKTNLNQIKNLLNTSLNPIKKVLDQHSSKLDALTLDVYVLQDKAKLLTDIHENTKDTRKIVDQLQERVEKLEDTVAIP
jgi:ubiquinone biosynthesis protein UbiJ